jgi:pentatricopeptide repeat protein
MSSTNFSISQSVGPNNQNDTFRGRGPHGANRGGRGSRGGIHNSEVRKESDFTSEDKRVVQVGKRGVNTTFEPRSPKPREAFSAQAPNSEKGGRVAGKNFRGREGRYPSSRSADAKTLIGSLGGKREPIKSESKLACEKINQSHSFVEALQLMTQEEFSPNSYIYSALFKKAQSWNFITLLFQNIPDREKIDVICNVYIKACGKNGQFAEAKKAFLHNPAFVPVPVPELRWFRKSINRARARARSRARK